jgi:hypothetical protein
MSHFTPGSRRNIKILLTLGASLLIALVVTQCRPVADDILGSRSSSRLAQNPLSCVVNCARAYNDSIRVESDVHVANVHACASDSICLALEESRHEGAVERIQTARVACIGNCHHQGGGSGGR